MNELGEENIRNGNIGAIKKIMENFNDPEFYPPNRNRNHPIKMKDFFS